MLEQLSEDMLRWSKLYIVEIMYYTLACMMMLEDFPESREIAAGALSQTARGISATFTRRHPLASWVATMLLCFAGPILGALLAAEPPLTAKLPNCSDCLFTASVVWYVLNYMPFGLVYKICNLLPCKLLIVSLRELYRAHQIHYGFIYASSKFQSSAFAVFIYTVVVGTGMMHMRLVQRLVCGVWSPFSVEFINPSLTTKMSCLAVLLLVYKQSLPVVLKDGLFAVMVIGFVIIKLAFFLRGLDVLSYFETYVSYVLFGGLVDDFEDWLRVVINTRFRSADADRTRRDKDSHSTR